MPPEIDLDPLLPRIAAGDLDAFGAFVAAAEHPLRRALTSFAAQVDLEAVVQETFLRLWQVAPQLVADGRPQALLRFCHRCARNLCLTQVRRLARARRDEPALIAQAEDELPGLVPEAAPDPILRAALLECRDKLPAKPQAALDSRIFAEGDTGDAALAQRLGMTLNTFLQNFTRARKLLADCLRRRGVEHPLLEEAT